VDNHSHDMRDRLQRLSALKDQGIRYVFAIRTGDGATLPDLDSLDLQGVEVIDPVAALERIAPDDQALAIASVARAMEGGDCVDELRMADGTWATSHLFDLTATHEILLGAVVDCDRLDVLRLGDRPEVPPRVARLTMDRQGRVLWAHDNWRRMFGSTFGSETDTHVVQLIHSEDRPRNFAVWAAVLASPEEPHRTRYRRRHVDGHWIWCEATFVNWLHDPNDPRVDVEVVDISSEMAAHEAVRARERLLQRLAERLPDGVLQIGDDRQVVYANARAHHLLGADATLTGLVERTVGVDRDILIDAIDAALGRGEDREAEVHVQRGPLGQPAVYRVTLRAVPGDDEDGGAQAISGAICCIADVTEDARRRRELETRATHDDLTEAYNRVATLQALEEALARAGPTAGVAVVFVDLDGFKQVNDTHGHSVGDRLLQAVATRLINSVRGDDVVGRFGGDEFLVVCPGLSDPSVVSDVVTRVERALSEPETIGGITVGLTASLGVACTFERGDAEQLIARADASMYVAKRSQD
jgi:diguanylate cyclase (GGDEF)-like protein/PAS domain S-box-containing protein